jgi:1,4-alpha-glucan branching enzyme
MARVTNKGKKRITFTVDADPGSEVYLVGSFNDWNPEGRRLVDKLNDGHFATTIMLPQGEHQYKYVINGAWCVDPNCAEWIANDLGSLNSVLRVG